MTYIFDLDGTLIDSTKRHWLLMMHILRQYNVSVNDGFGLDFITYKSYGNSGYDYLTNVLRIDEGLAKEIMTLWINHIEDEELLDTDELYDDAISILGRIHRIGGSVVLLTIRRNIIGLNKELKRLGLDRYELKVVRKGEDKAMVLNEYSDCIMIGDTEIDYYAALKVGCASYILNRGFRDKSFWDKNGVISYSSLSCLIEASEIGT